MRIICSVGVEYVDYVQLMWNICGLCSADMEYVWIMFSGCVICVDYVQLMWNMWIMFS